ncbi:hypothetical protein V9T40_002939 [Parthenolecanium corni]|uniref:RalBP1-associated Eps domain-containing protein 1 n=1 Tax=Parthenolecanium corni TaxID=536013 RepID=A0AAN9TJE9_9HEMI
MDEVTHELTSKKIKENGEPIVTNTSLSPDGSSTTSGTPTPPNGIPTENWASRYENIGACEEQRQLLGTEEESSDKHSSDGEADVCDVWAMTKEQHEYYEAQFKQLQSDVNALINGYDARTYFEKSKLPVEELRKIWQLSDITRDGALSLAEFKIAMHLVVLKRNGIALPNALPPSLVYTVPVTIPSTSPSNAELSLSPQSKGKEWTKFVDSPTSTLSSPGSKPVNFDFLRPSVEQNPKILHPVAVRATPVLENAGEDMRNDFKKMSVTETTPVALDGVPIKPIQRPQPKKHTAPGPGAIPPPPQSNIDDSSGGGSGPTSLPVIAASKKEPPPPPPPRPNRTHFRSSSLDLNKLGKITNSAPSVPPRTSPGSNSPSRISDGLTTGASQLTDFPRCTYYGAFHVYKRSDTKSNCDVPGNEKKPVISEIRVDEKNRYLRAVCQELQEELNALREERIALQFKLERLHSHSPVSIQTP